MVLLIIIPIKWLFHWEYTLFSDKPIFDPRTHGFSSALTSFLSCWRHAKGDQQQSAEPQGAKR